MSRGTKLTPERYKAILANARLGCTESMTADMVNISHNSIGMWRERGDKTDEEPYSSFAKDLARVKAEYSADNLKIINKAAPDNWQAAFRMLEFKNKKDFSDKHSYAEFPKEIINLDYTEQVKFVMGMVSEQQISLQEGNLFIDMISKGAKVEDVTRLREQLFEIEEKQK